jgi:hypothetical protein
MAIEKELLDQLLAGRDPNDVFAKAPSTRPSGSAGNDHPRSSVRTWGVPRTHLVKVGAVACPPTEVGIRAKRCRIQKVLLSRTCTLK